MSRVLLFDAEHGHASRIAWALRSISCHTVICSDLDQAFAAIQTQTFDAVVVAVAPGAKWEGPVEAIRDSALRAADPPQVVCLVRGPYRGPSERVYAARKGFKVVYEQ